jgi:ankyrin repeat protein
MGLEWPTELPYAEPPTTLPLEVILDHILPVFPRDWMCVSLRCQSVAFPLLLTDPRIDPTTSKSGNSPIIEASKCGSLRLVKLLSQDSRVNVADEIKPAMEACALNGHIHVFKFLFNKLVCQLKPAEIFRLLDLAIEGGHELMFTHIMKIALSMSIITSGVAIELAMHAIDKGHYHITKLLLKIGFVTNELLCIAARRGDYHILRLLLKKLNGFDYPTCEYNDPTPLHEAAAAGHVECAKLLLAAGYAPNVTVLSSDPENITPIREAMVHRQLEMLKLFAEDPRINTNTKNNIQQYLSDFFYN